MSNNSAESASCIQCGQCCRNGGPALHRQDQDVLQSGLILARDLYTLRTGELAHVQAEGKLTPLKGEIVKIAPSLCASPGDWTCRFLTPTSACAIYKNRPQECQTLFCKKPEALLKMSCVDHLGRKEILALLQAPPWWPELIEAHADGCGYELLTRMAQDLDNNPEARRKFLQLVEFDRSFRDLVLEKKAAQKEELNFLFGRPLLQTIIMFGLDARPGPDGSIKLVKITEI